jgi:cytochrome P450
VDGAAGAFAAFQDPAMRADPYPLFHTLREQSPLPLQGGAILLVGGYADAQRVLRDVTFSSQWPDGHPGAETSPDAQSFLTLDPPDHTRLRGLVAKAFTPRSVARLEARIDDLVDEAFTAVGDRGTIDIVDDLAHPMPVKIICEWLGVPASDAGLIREWSRQLTRTLDIGVTDEERVAIGAANAEFNAYFRELIAHRRVHPADDLLTELIAAEERGDRLNSAELVATLNLLVTAGHETSTNLIANGVLALLRNPGELATLRSQPELAAAAVEETLRYDPPIQLTGRVATEQTDVGGVEVAAGTWVIVLLGAVNRDPEVYPEPDRFSLTRSAIQHLAFSVGPHFCLGAGLARLEGTAVFREFAARFADPRLDAGSLEYRPHVNLRGPARMIVHV